MILEDVVAERDTVSLASYVFLVPSSGGDQLVRLHQDLYSGPLRGDVRQGLPYVPHITVGQKTWHEECLTVAEELRRRPISIRAKVVSLAVVALRATGVESVGTVRLGG